MQVNDAAQYSTLQTQTQVKEQANVSILKKTMEQTEQLVQELQKSLQKMPPPNPNGKISLYA